MNPKTLLEALRKLSKAYAAKPKHPALACVRLSCVDGQLTLTGTNLDIFETASLSCNWAEFDVLLGYEFLKRLLSAVTRTAQHPDHFAIIPTDCGVRLANEREGWSYDLKAVLPVSEFPLFAEALPMAEKPAWQYSEAEWEASAQPAATMTAPSVCSHRTATIAVCSNYWIDLQTAITEGLFDPLNKPKKAALYAAIAAANGDWKAITLSGNYQQDRRFAVAKGLFGTADKPKKKALCRAIEAFNGAIEQYAA